MIAALFPGQGSQKVGMAKELFANTSFYSFLKEKAKKHQLEEFIRLAINGPEDKLNQTAVAQPLLFLFDLAYFKLFHDFYSEQLIYFYAGHSLGEYAALVAAEVLEFDEAMFLVKKRSEFMAEEAQKSDGGMLAVLKVTREVAEKISKQTGVQIANYNSPQQFVFSGLKRDLNLVAAEVAKCGGRSLFLSVSGAFHSKFMRPAGEKLFPYLMKASFNYENAKKVVFNLTGKPLAQNEYLPEVLAKQVYSPVRWQDSIDYIVSNEVSIFVELGPGRVLSGLLKYINSDAVGLTFDDSRELDSLNSILRRENV